MEASIKKLPKSEVEVTIKVPYDEYFKAEKAALEEIGKNIKVDGFRSGSVPENIVREKAGEDIIRRFTLERIIPISYSKAVKDNDIQVISQPRVEVKEQVQKEGDTLVYVATVSIMPEVKLGNYKKIKVKRKEVKVSDEELKETLEMLMNRFAEWKDVERETKEGDRVEIDFEGFDEAGAAIPNTASKNHPVVLGSKAMVPGFEEAIVGMKKDEEKEFHITFPKDYHAKPMQGKKVKFKAKLGRVEERMAQELDEGMVEKITGQKQSVDDFKQRVAEDLEHEMKQREQAEVDNKVVQEIIKVTSAEIPESLIQEEINMMKEERKQQITRQGLTWEQYLQHIKKTDEDFGKDHVKAAEERLLARLGVNEIIRQEKVQVTDDEVKARVQELAGRYPEEQRKQVLEHYKEGGEGYRQLKNNMSADTLINMFVEG